ncbi:MAG: T9SS type A sorting domain-containing protein [Ignavibacteriales bacterium]|nr:T9SS type A sorting domain-containing protein [Ignavibacteriales bacterium]
MKIRYILGLLVLIIFCNKVSAQILISVGSGYSQNFDGMTTATTAALPSNWKADTKTTVSTLGTYSAASTATTQAGTNIATGAANGIYNFFNGTNHAVGGLSSSSASKSVNIYAWFQNNADGEITSLTISYDVVKYRNGTNAAGFSIQMYYSTDGSAWTSAGTNFKSSFAGGDASNAGTATPPIATVSVTSQTLSGLNIVNGGNLYLAWSYGVTTGTTTSNAQAVGIDNVSIPGGGVLPVELTTFKAFKSGNNIKISWATANEINNSGFEIAKSQEGQNFWKTIGSVSGSGNSNSPKKYYFLDRNPFYGKTDYKLIQIDNDGTRKNIGQVEFEFLRPNNYSIEQNFPNPFNPTTMISFYIPEDANVKLAVYNILGVRVKELLNGYLTEGKYDIVFDGKDLPSGCYMYTLTSGNFSKTMKMTLLK